ncbi:hypothetical protein KFK09_025731 [Dendrobium nobile]|uniref:Uncharacterized protein n=1 Tax=Dendrobium nobile TaxID=94219 RepID=A0A8T3A6E4_DENNO|nr:hypothetical protein KFK09_025731 [Dendrobium nobile]
MKQTWPLAFGFAVIVFSGVGAAAYMRTPPGRILTVKSSESDSHPQQVRISIVGSDQMLISWITKDKNIPSLVEYGKTPGIYDCSASGESTSHRFFFYTSGNIHHVEIGPLDANTTYYYRCGGVGGESTFKTPPLTLPIEFVLIDFSLSSCILASLCWRLIDKNLISALFSTISPAVLPYVITSTTAQEVWAVLERRLQSSNRSRVLQLKNELHHIQMKNQTMQQYLAQVKNIVDNIAASGTKIDPEDIVLYILNGHPVTYNSFKTYIRASSLPADLDALYSLLCSEEIHINQEIKNDQLSTTAAYYANPQNQTWNKNPKRSSKYRNNGTRNQVISEQSTYQPPAANSRPTCQICSKIGHTANNCWHCCNLSYAPPMSAAPRALLAQPNPTAPQTWVLDSGASSHMTSNGTNIQFPSSYQGQDLVSVANGTTIPIQNYGQGILPLLDSSRKLHLCNLLHVPALTHNLFSVSKLTSDNSVSITFDSNGFEIKDLQDQQLLLRGRLIDGIYKIHIAPTKSTTALQAATTLTATWHGHLARPPRPPK